MKKCMYSADGTYTSPSASHSALVQKRGFEPLYSREANGCKFVADSGMVCPLTAMYKENNTIIQRFQTCNERTTTSGEYSQERMARNIVVL